MLERESHAPEECMKELTSAQEVLENTQSLTVEKIMLYRKFKGMNREANQLCNKWANCLLVKGERR